jgi:hypothetical protein
VIVGAAHSAADLERLRVRVGGDRGLLLAVHSCLPKRWFNLRAAHHSAALSGSGHLPHLAETQQANSERKKRFFQLPCMLKPMASPSPCLLTATFDLLAYGRIQRSVHGRSSAGHVSPLAGRHGSPSARMKLAQRMCSGRVGPNRAAGRTRAQPDIISCAENPLSRPPTRAGSYERSDADR